MHTEAVLQRLDQFTLNKARTSAAEILGVGYSLIRDMSKQTYRTCVSLAIEYLNYPSH
jgi:hypothetical protein